MREPNVLDEQIIKALESTMYTDEVRRAAYDLIMRQRREIERLTHSRKKTRRMRSPIHLFN
jgi:hypothetical protein